MASICELIHELYELKQEQQKKSNAEKLDGIQKQAEDIAAKAKTGEFPVDDAIKLLESLALEQEKFQPASEVPIKDLQHPGMCATKFAFRKANNNPIPDAVVFSLLNALLKELK
ncbi:hypothetical protein FACS1894214_4460 [Planctomycetales bacterium]|nr:hypothetical protein FACS1894214_4460 [Planctomycetales bacterium]